MDGTFTTETDANFMKKETLKITAILFVISSLLACLGLLISVGFFLFLELIFVISLVYTHFLRQKNYDYELKWDGGELSVKNKKTSEISVLGNIPARDYVFARQTKKEKALDYGAFIVKGTLFSFGGVKNFAETKDYIILHCAGERDELQKPK